MFEVFVANKIVLSFLCLLFNFW